MNSILDKNIEDINFKRSGGIYTKIVNTCRNLGISTVRDLLQTSSTRLLRCRSFGRTCLREVEQFLDENGLEFGYIPKEGEISSKEESSPEPSVDWEQRRFDLAQAVVLELVKLPLERLNELQNQEGLPPDSVNDNSYFPHYPSVGYTAAQIADSLIRTLKEKSIKKREEHST